MAQPMISPRTPVACAGCFGQYPERQHVDFRSAIEGPLSDPSNLRSPRIDWVVLCEDCIRSANALLPEVVDLHEQHARQIAQLTQRAEEAEAYADSLEDALARRPDSQREARETAPALKAQARSTAGRTPAKAPGASRRSRYDRSPA